MQIVQPAARAAIRQRIMRLGLPAPLFTIELEGIDRKTAERAMGLAAAKLGVKSKFVAREEAHTDAS